MNRCASALISPLAQQQFQVVGGEVADDAVVGGDDGVGEVFLGLLQFEDFVLDGVFGDQAVGEDSFRLANAMRAVDGLSLGGGVPPRIENEDVIGRGQV